MTEVMVEHKCNLLYGQSDYVKAWVEERLPDVSGVGLSNGKAIGVMSDNGKKLIAGVVYNEYQKKYQTMQLHMAADNPMWAKPGTIAELLSYPFDQLNIFKCWISITSDNPHSLKTMKHIGFKQEAVLRHHCGFQRHAHILRMYQYEYKKLYGDFSHG